MKRFHVHAHVSDLRASIGFYSRLFGSQPTRVEPGYAKWMLDDPRLNFAISTTRGAAGVGHLGLQTDTMEELAALRSQNEAAGLALADEGEASCCYARSHKHWIVDPQGIAWEQFHTLHDMPASSAGCATQPAAASAGCCAATAGASPSACC